MNADNPRRDAYQIDTSQQTADESSTVTQSVLSGCTADCEDGSVASVDCTGLCDITNQDCAANVQGQVHCLSTAAVDQCNNQCGCAPRSCHPFECGLVLDDCTGTYVDCGRCSTCPSNFQPSIRVTGFGTTCAEALSNAIFLARGQSNCPDICGERIKPLLCPAVPVGQTVRQQIDYSVKCLF
jgi:hypothetical protein